MRTGTQIKIKHLFCLLSLLVGLSATKHVFADTHSKVFVNEANRDENSDPNSEKMGSLTFTVSNRITSPASLIKVQVCKHGKFDLNLRESCLTLPDTEPVGSLDTRTFHLKKSDLDTIIKDFDAEKGANIQFRFKDVGNDQTIFRECAEYPQTVLDPNIQEKKFLIEIWGRDHLGYSCRIYKKQDEHVVAEPKEEGIVDNIVHKFNEYKTWMRNDKGLTFSITNKIKERKPRLQVQVCSYKDLPLAVNCINMGEVDYIDYNKTRIYHFEKEHLDKLLELATDSKIQFRFKDTGSNFGRFRPCENFPFTYVLKDTDKGQRFEITVSKVDPMANYTCNIKNKG